MSFYRSKLYSEDQCLQRLFDLRFAKIRCPQCGRKNAYHRNSKKQCFSCNCGRSHLFPRKGTIFGSSHLPLLTWIHGIFLLTGSAKGMTVHTLASRLNIAYPSAWRMKRMIADVLGVRKDSKFRQWTFESILKKCVKTVVM